MKTIVTRHQGFVDYLLEEKVVSEGDYVVIPHAAEEQVRGQDVITSGLPLKLAALCKSVTVVDLEIPAEMRGVELTAQQMRDYAKGMDTWVVSSVEQIQQTFRAVGGCLPGEAEEALSFVYKKLMKEKA